jgi:hypothetical protein
VKTVKPVGFTAFERTNPYACFPAVNDPAGNGLERSPLRRASAIGTYSAVGLRQMLP